MKPMLLTSYYIYNFSFCVRKVCCPRKGTHYGYNFQRLFVLAALEIQNDGSFYLQSKFEINAIVSNNVVPSGLMKHTYETCR